MRAPLSPSDLPLLQHLVERKPSENIPLLLEMSRQQAALRKPADVLFQYVNDSFVGLSVLEGRLAHRLDGFALEAAADFEAVLLSPLAALASCSVVSPTTQDRSVTTTRNTEVVSDPTNVLALECAKRLARSPAARVRLCTLHQVTRPQRFPDAIGFTQHFRLFALAEAGRAEAEHRFEVETMARHASVFIRLFDIAERAGYKFAERRLDLHVDARQCGIGDRLRAELGRVLPNVPLFEHVLSSNYYDGVRLLVGASTLDGEYVQLGDVGRFDWMGKLTSNRRFRFVASGLGIQLFPILFHPNGGRA